MLKSRNQLKLAGVALFLSLLAGCGSTPRTEVSQPQGPVSLVKAELSSSQYLALADSVKDTASRSRYQLLAAHAMLNEANPQGAAQLLGAIRGNLAQDTEIQAEFKYLTARTLEQSGDAAAALKTLVYPGHWKLPDWQWVSYHQLRAQLFRIKKQPMDEVRELAELGKYLNATDAAELNDRLWGILAPMHEETIETFMQEATSPVYKGWLQLAFIAKHYAVDPQTLVRFLGDWQRENPFHPAANRLPSDLDRALNAKPYLARNIAVLLPLSGSAASAGYAIKQGILAGYLAADDSTTKVRFYDSGTNAVAAYQQALAEGAEFIIGPLLQSSIEAIEALPKAEGPSVPQLYLNQIGTYQANVDKFYFSLSPSEEASDAAERLYRDGVEKPLLLASADATGRRMAEAFNQTWRKQTGDMAEVHYFEQGNEMKLTVQRALGVLDSEARIARMKEILGRRLEAEFRSREDVDAIYMIASPQEIQLLKPFIDVSFSVFADPVPMYTSSRARPQDNARQVPQEFNNVMVSDIPWLMQLSSESRDINDLWPTWNNGQKRLFIMGWDALDLVGKLAQMRAFPGFQFQGRGGVLSVTHDGLIKRQLSWGKIQRGVLRPL
ncbi:penicillin-binding protein activator [Shewanella litorisediminis]|uniref:Penicillin-binding protein activator n=1 Tax=Shewanella litorisediminis TaxID=1173586 RepID=A0ABX7G2V2_9GAMM|nr:penicillin-binding protein activator [Shewanella litorisediminis]MCL2917088.1 penicillin-binding protein activator [Shewanella litorisediminis]QRH01567.1 penicillin-binding protein activator [Shewanella litorisediminis]